MKKILLLLFLGSIVSAQTLNQTHSISDTGSANTFLGGYTFAYATSGTPWNGSLISFGGIGNRYDTQISTDYGPNGGSHISFRTKNGDFDVWNNWQELATKGTNNFIGNQNIKGQIHAIDGDIVSTISSNEGGSLRLFNTLKKGSQAHQWAIYNMTGNYSNSLQFWNYSPDGSKGGARLKISDEGNMALYGKLEATEIKVTETPTADFVFEEDYKLPTLEEVENHIKTKKHLPEIASAKEMEKEGVNVGEFQIKLLQKIEELTLYIIEQNKELKQQREEINKLKQK